MKLDSLLVWLHVSGNIFWIGAICAVALLILSDTGSAKDRGTLALRVYMRVAVPAFLVSFTCGAGRLLMNTSYYFKEHHWMHPKLLFALIVIGLHHAIGARAKKLANGDSEEAGPTKGFLIGLAVSALLATFFVVMRIPD